MKASLLIDRLDALIAEHGDLEVACGDQEYRTYYGFTKEMVGVRNRGAPHHVPKWCEDDYALGEHFIVIGVIAPPPTASSNQNQ